MTEEVLAASGRADISYSLKNNRPFSDHLENFDSSSFATTRQKKANCRVLIFDLRDTIYNEKEKEFQKKSTVLRKYLVQKT